MSSSQKRFRAPRINYREQLMVRPTEDRMSIPAQTSNVSETGLFALTKWLCPTGTEVDFELPLPAGTVPLRGRVAWVQPEANFSPARPAGMGIEFVDLSSSARSAIRQLVDKVCPRRPAMVEFNRSAVLHATAQRTVEGIGLTIELPFLRIGNEAVVNLPGNEKRGGAIGHVAFEPADNGGAPKLRVTLIEAEDEEWPSEASGEIEPAVEKPEPTIETQSVEISDEIRNPGRNN